MTIGRSRRLRIGRRSQFGDQSQDVGEKLPQDSDLGHQEGNITVMAGAQDS